MGWFSFVGIVATLMSGSEETFAQSVSSWPIYRSDSGLSGRAKVEGPVIPDLFWVKSIGVEKIQSPVVSGDGTVIFTSRGDKYVYALHPDNSEKWRFSHQLPNGSFETFSHPPSLGSDGVIYIGSHEGGFFALNPDGSLKWRATVGGYVGTAPNIDQNGNLYVACDDAQLYVFNPAGSLLCTGSLDGIKPNNTPAIVSNAKIYVPAGNSIFVFNSSCARLARWLLPNLGEVAWVVSNADGSVLYAGSVTGPLVVALDPQTGKEVWSYSYDGRFGPPSQPALGPEGTIYFAGFNAGLLVALHPDGKEKWTHDQGNARYKTMPVVDASGDIYIVNEALGLAAFAPNKTLLWNLPNVQCKYAPAFGPDGTLYVPSLQKLYAVRHQPPFAVRLEFVSGDSQTACIDSVLADSIVAQVFDQYDEPFEGQPVRFRVIKGGGEPKDATVITDSFGIADTTWQLGSVLGEQQLEISSQRNDQHLIGSPDTVIATAHGPAIDGEREVVFDPTPVKSASEKTYEIFNRSDCILTVNRLDITDDSHPSFFVITPVADTVIPPHGTIVVRLQFAPLDSGTHNATLHIYSNDAARSPFNVALRGEATTAPMIVVVPDSLDFGKIKVGDDSTQALAIFNAGTALLVVSDFRFSDPAYTINLPAPLAIPAGGRREGLITFTPTEARQYPATLEIFSNDRNNNPVVVKLTGSGAQAPQIDAAPNPLRFGEVCLDSCAIDTVAIFNLGNDTLVVESIKSADTIFFVEDRELILLPGDSAKVPVTFCPKEAKNYAGKLLIESNDPVASTFEVALQGQGIAPKIVLVPQPPSFEVCAGEIVNGVLNITNDSDCALRIDSVKFAIVSTGLLLRPTNNWQTSATALIIPPHQSLPFAYSFQAPEKNFEVRFRVRSNGTPDPATVVIPGTILPPVIAAVDTVDFGDVPAGEAKTLVAQAWSEQCKIQINSARITGLDSFAFALDSTLIFPIILSEQDTATLPVTFHPKDEGIHTAFLEVVSNDPHADRDTIRIVLIGNGVRKQPDIEVRPDSIAFEAGCKDGLPIAVTVSNVGDATLHVTKLEFSNPAFSTTHAGSFEVAPGASETVWVLFTPTAAPVETGSLSIHSDDPDEPIVVVKLRAESKPEIEVAPVRIAFAPACTEDSSAVTVFNLGKDTLRINSLVFSNGAFSTLHASGFTIAPCDSEIIWVRFSPTIGEADSGTLAIHSNDADEPVVFVQLQGTGGAPDIAADPPVFDPVEVQTCAGKTNADTAIVVLRNEGTCDLIITALRLGSPSPFKFIPPVLLPITIPAGGSRSLPVVFEPPTSGVFVDTLLVESNDPYKNPLAIALRGEGLAQPDIEVAPLVLNFGNVGKDSTKCLPLTVRNRGELDLIIAEMSFSCPVFATETREFRLRCNEDSVLSICFTPKEAIAYSCTLTIVSNDPDDNPVFVILNGNGTPPPPPPPGCIVVTPEFKNFGTLCDEDSAMFVVSDTCAGPLHVSKLDFTNPAFWTRHSSSFTILPGQSDTIWVHFKPVAAKSDAGSLLIHSDAINDSVVVVPLQGAGGAPDIAVEKDEVVFPPVEVQRCSGSIKSTALTFEVFNKGACDLTISSLSLSAGSPFEVVPKSPPPLVIPPGASHSLTLIFKPQTNGIHSDTLRIAGDDPDPNKRVIKVVLRGEGLFLPDLEVKPSALNFDSTRVGSPAELPVTVRNLGALLLVVDRLTVSQPGIFGIDTGEFSLACNQDSAVTVAFSPKEAKAYKDTLWIWHNDNNNTNPFPVPLNGLGTLGALSACDRMEFDESCVGKTSEKSCTITNTGSADFNITAVLLASERGVDDGAKESGFAIVSTGLAGNFAVNTSKAIRVAFTAKSIDRVTDTLLIFTDLPAPNSQLAIPLAGSARNDHPEIKITPLLSFVGRLDKETAVQPVLLTNMGCQALELGNARLGKSKYFFIRQLPEKKTLLQDESAVVLVSFKGDKFTTFDDDLSVETNDPQRPLAVAKLNGQVTDGELCFESEPSAVDFAKVNLKRRSEPQEVKLINCSKETRIKISVSLPRLQHDFSLSKTEFLILPNPETGENTENLYVTFTPQEIGIREDTLKLLITVPNPDGGVSEGSVAYVYLRGEGVGDPEKVQVVSNVVTPNDDGFNEETVIEYSEKKYPEAALHIFDLRGLPVRVFRRPTGPNQFAWNGRDENGGLVLPSVYLWILEHQGKRVASGRFVVIR